MDNTTCIKLNATTTVHVIGRVIQKTKCICRKNIGHITIKIFNHQLTIQKYRFVL